MQHYQYSVTYHKRFIISLGLYIVYPISDCGLYCRAVSVTDRYMNKEILQFLDLKSTVYNQ